MLNLLLAFFIGLLVGLGSFFILVNIFMKKSIQGIHKRLEERNKREKEKLEEDVNYYNKTKKLEEMNDQETNTMEYPIDEKDLITIEEEETPFINENYFLKKGTLNISYMQEKVFSADCILDTNTLSFNYLNELENKNVNQNFFNKKKKKHKNYATQIYHPIWLILGS